MLNYLAKRKIRLLLASFLMIALVLASIRVRVFADADTAQEEDVNLALGKVVTTSDIEGAGLEGDKAVDGNAGTRWSSAFSDPQWLVVDLGEKTEFTRVVLQWETSYGKAYEIQVSDDNETWETIYSTTDSDGGVDILKNLKGNGRYVRLYGLERALPYGYSLWELGIYKSSEGLEITGKSTEPGNAYIEGDSPYFALTGSFDVNQTSDVLIKYKVLSYDNRNMYEEEFTETIEPGGAKKLYNLPIDVPLKKGLYNLLITAATADGKLSARKVIPFSIISKTETIPMDSSFGTCTHFAQGIGDQDVLTGLAADAGLGMLRDEYYWSNVEQEKGVYTFDNDAYIDAALSNGLQPLIILSYGNSLYDEGRAPETEEAIEGFANYCKAMAEHFKGKVKYFEIWNEWNGGMGNEKLLDAAAYAKVLKAAYTSIKEVNPDAFIVGGAAVMADYSWAKKVLEAGGGAYMDAFSYHPYSSDPEGGAFEATIKEMRKVLTENGFKGQAWVTELGWSNNNEAKGGVTEIESASYLVQARVIKMANPESLDKLFFYELLNGGTNEEIDGDNFGILYRDPNYPRKTGFIAQQAAAELLAGATFEKSYDLDKDLRMYRFSREGKPDLLVVWTTLEPKTVGVKLGCDQLNILDIMGNAKDEVTFHQVLNMTFSNVPVYLEGDFSDEITLQDPVYQVEETTENVVPGDTLIIDIDRNGDAKKQAGTYEVDLPDGWELISGNTFDKGKKDELQIKLPDEITNKNVVYIYPTNESGQRMSKLQVTTTKVEPFAITVIPMPVKDKSFEAWDLQINLKNNYSMTTLSGGKISIIEPEAWADGQSYSYEELQAGKSMTLEIPIPAKPELTPQKLKFKVQPESGDAYVIERDITFLAAAYADKAITIDGNITDEEWKDAMLVTVDQESSIRQIEDWGGAKDLSLAFRTKWDEKYLYLAVTVQDDVHYQPYKTASLWQADGLQISTEPNRVTGPGSGGWNELNYALNSVDNLVEKFRSTAIPGQTQSALPTHLCSIQRVNNQETVYEIAMPWDELMPKGSDIVPGLDIGFSMLANDNDGEKRDGWIEYMSGIGQGKDPSKYGDLVLVDFDGKFSTGKDSSDKLYLILITVGALVLLGVTAIAVLLKTRKKGKA